MAGSKRQLWYELFILIGLCFASVVLPSILIVFIEYSLFFFWEKAIQGRNGRRNASVRPEDFWALFPKERQEKTLTSDLQIIRDFFLVVRHCYSLPFGLSNLFSSLVLI